MQNFPTRLIFGENAIEKLHDVMTAFGKRVLHQWRGLQPDAE